MADSSVIRSERLCALEEDVNREVFEANGLSTREEVVEVVNLDDSVDIHDDVDKGGVIVFNTATTGFAGLDALDVTKCPNVVRVFADLVVVGLVAVTRLLDPHSDWQSLEMNFIELVVDAAAGCGAVVVISLNSAVAVCFVTVVIADEFDAVADGFDVVVWFQCYCYLWF